MKRGNIGSAAQMNVTTPMRIINTTGTTFFHVGAGSAPPFIHTFHSSSLSFNHSHARP